MFFFNCISNVFFRKKFHIQKIKMDKNVNIKRIVFILYCIIPFVFYGIPFLISIPNGYIRMHFFNSHNIPTIFFFTTLVGHCILGFLIYKSLSVTNYIVQSKVSSNLTNFSIILLYSIYLFIPLGYFGMITNVIFLMLIGSYRPKNLIFFILAVIAFLKLVYGYDRYHFVVIILLWILPLLSRMSTVRMIWLFIGSVFLMVYILQPIKAGNLPFSDSIYTLIYTVRHMFPIYIAGYLSYVSDFQFIQLLSESLPLFKSIYGSSSSIELIAEKGLPIEMLNSGSRLGSNSALYFSNMYGLIVLSLILLALKLVLKIFRDVYIYNTLLLLVIGEGPMFIRHSFGQAFINLIIGFFIAIIFSLLITIRRGYKKTRILNDIG